MSEEPAAKKTKAEDIPQTAVAPDKHTTFFIRGVSLRHRGDVVNGLLCQWREALGISDWYQAAAEAENALHLLPSCPLEMVHVESSRRPYFLLEFRYPNEEELARQERNREAGEHEEKEGEEKKTREEPPQKVITVSEETLQDIASRLLNLVNTKDASALTYRDSPVSISIALGGVTVAAERHKLELRDAEKKKIRQQEQQKQQQQQKEAQATSAAAQPSAPTTTTSFVPRTVRRRN